MLRIRCAVPGVPEVAVRLPGIGGEGFGLKSGVKDAVPPDILAVFLNLEFNY
jgi:hypothetical protein